MRRVVFDVDGVVWASGDAICDMYNLEYKDHPDFKEAKFTECFKWDMSDVLPLATVDKMEDMFCSTEFFDTVVFIEGMEDLINELHSRGVDIIFCSRGGVLNITKKLKKLYKSFPWATHLPVVAPWTTNLDKDLINMKNSILIDDKKSNLDNSNADVRVLFNEHGNYNVEWNRGWKGLRASNASELRELILENI